MKRTLVLLLVLAMSLVAVGTVSAQGTTVSKAPGVWGSSINIQNVGTKPEGATVDLIFHNADGVEVLRYTVTPAIPPGKSRSYYVPTEIPGLASGQYSVEVDSSEPLQVVANASSTAPATAGAYMGVQAAEVAKTLTFPGLYKNYYGFYSEVVLQNADSTQATVHLKFYNQKTGAFVTQVDGTIPSLASRVFAMQDLAAVPSGNTQGLLSLKVESDKDLAGVANVWTSAKYGEFSDYNASQGATTVYAPALYNNYYGFVSALTVQNLDPSLNADIKVTYSNGQIETKTLQPLQAWEYYQPANPLLPSGNTNGVFSAKIESVGAGSAKIAALVTVEDKGKGLLASYNGASQATSSVNVPVVMKSYFGWFSAETVQNVGGAPTNITITYATGQTRTFNNVPPNGTVNIIEKASAGSVLPDGSSVSAVISSSPAQPIVAVVQENSESRYSSTPGDYLLAYTGVAQ